MTIVLENAPAALAPIDKLAKEYGVNVALSKPADPRSLLKTVEGLNNKIGACIDTGSLMDQGKPADALATLKDRIVAVRLHDRSAIAANPGDRNIVILAFADQAVRLLVHIRFGNVEASST